MKRVTLYRSSQYLQNEMIPAWVRQMRGEDYYLLRKVPETAKPYQLGLHGQTGPAAAE